VEPLGPGGSNPPSTTGRVRWRGRDLEVVHVWREDLGAGTKVPGPAVILEYSSTTWVPPHWTLEVDRWGSLHLSRDR
jgi:N-methylhydantoinase A